ncbi:MAG: hypothetical protein M0R51_09590 [Clostridia bacterium]|jgi:hypothetical protein|nr:hypothetical protein [Clostridia bacterium]
MKIFNSDNSRWDDRVNFVDKNNVLVGYEISTQCCEEPGWFISDKEEIEKLENQEFDLSDYFFDINFFKEIEDLEWLEEGSMVIFKLVSEKSKPLYLHLYNIQNGFYDCGFIFSNNNDIIKQSSI